MSVGDYPKNHSAKDLLLDDRLLSYVSPDGEMQPWSRLYYDATAIEEARQFLARIRSAFEEDANIETEAQALWVRIHSSLSADHNEGSERMSSQLE